MLAQQDQSSCLRCTRNGQMHVEPLERQTERSHCAAHNVPPLKCASSLSQSCWTRRSSTRCTKARSSDCPSAVAKWSLKEGSVPLTPLARYFAYHAISAVRAKALKQSGSLCCRRHIVGACWSDHGACPVQIESKVQQTAILRHVGNKAHTPHRDRQSNRTACKPRLDQSTPESRTHNSKHGYAA